MSDPYNLKQYIRKVEDFPIDGITFRDITSLIETPDAFVETCTQLTDIKLFDATQLQALKAGAIVQGLYKRSVSAFILARKPGKLPNETYVRILI